MVSTELAGVETPAGASRRELRDLAALLALPAMWVDQNPDFIAAGLVGVLFAMLNLESAYVRFDDPTGGLVLERWRPDGPRAPIELEPVLSAAPTREGGTSTVSVPSPFGDGTLRVTSMSPAFPGENGLVLVGSRRSDFPTDLELHHLRVAVGQATISIQTARRLAAERAARLAAEIALRRRNEFLESLAHDLVSPLAALAEHAAKARAFASEPEYSSPIGSVKTVPIVKATDMPRSQAGAPLLALPARLTRREAEVLGLLAQGLSNREIAGVLWLSDRTVERHITGLYRKIGVERRSEATAFAFHHGLVDADAHEA